LKVHWLIATLLLVSSGAAIAQQDKKTDDEKPEDPDTGESTVEESTLGLLPNPLQKYGVKFAATYIGETLGNISGGLKQGAIYEGRLNLAVDADLQKLTGLSELTFHANMFQIHGDGLSRSNLQNFLVASGIEALPSTRLYEIWFEKKWGDKVALRAGQPAADTEFINAKYTDVFTNASLGWRTDASAFHHARLEDVSGAGDKRMAADSQHWETGMGIKRTTAAFALGLLFAPAVATGNFDLVTSAMAEPALTKTQSDALDAYNNAVNNFKSILSQRRAQIDSKQPLPDLPGQALYLARNAMMGARKDLTDALPSKIGRPNKFRIPPAYFDADNEPLIDEYTKLFAVMQAPPAGAQNSETPFKDVADLGAAIARARGLDAANAEAAGRISLGMFFAETNGNQNIGNARSNKYKGSFQTGTSEDQNGRRKWAAIKPSIAALDPALSARDDKEEARVGGSDHRFNHWTAVRDGLMNAHAELFRQIPDIARALPNPVDQMKLFELIQIVPAPTRSALKSGDLLHYRVSDPTIMKYLRNNSMFAFGQADRARTSATFREIMDAMFLFNEKFERALSTFNEIKARQKG
jgi:hypothetical protein